MENKGAEVEGPDLKKEGKPTRLSGLIHKYAINQANYLGMKPFFFSLLPYNLRSFLSLFFFDFFPFTHLLTRLMFSPLWLTLEWLLLSALWGKQVHLPKRSGSSAALCEFLRADAMRGERASSQATIPPHERNARRANDS